MAHLGHPANTASSIELTAANTVSTEDEGSNTNGDGDGPDGTDEPWPASDPNSPLHRWMYNYVMTNMPDRERRFMPTKKWEAGGSPRQLVEREAARAVLCNYFGPWKDGSRWRVPRESMSCTLLKIVISFIITDYLYILS